MEHGTAIFSMEHEKEAGEGGGGSRGATAGYVRMEESLEWEDDEWQCTQVRRRVAILSLRAQGPVRGGKMSRKSGETGVWRGHKHGLSRNPTCAVP